MKALDPMEFEFSTPDGGIIVGALTVFQDGGHLFVPAAGLWLKFNSTSEAVIRAAFEAVYFSESPAEAILRLVTAGIAFRYDPPLAEDEGDGWAPVVGGYIRPLSADATAYVYASGAWSLTHETTEIAKGRAESVAAAKAISFDAFLAGL